MYDSLFGKILQKTPTRLVLDVGGVGYELEIPLSTAERLPREGEARLLVHLHVREDTLKLFGFATDSEREFFRLLLRVSGVGPTLAVAILSRASVNELADAIATGRADFLKSLKGIGPKTANRLITELSDTVPAAGETLTPGGAHDSRSDDAIHALEVLGCPAKAARKAVTAVLAEDADAEVEAIVRRSLQLIWPG